MSSDMFRAKVAEQPENNLFRFSLGQALFTEENFADAYEHLKYCADKKADWMVPRILLGKVCLKLNQIPDATKWLEEALQLAIIQNHEGPEAEIRELLNIS